MATYSNSTRVLQPLSFRNLNLHYVNRKASQLKLITALYAGFPPENWTPPPEDFVKMNFDGGVNPFNETAGANCAELQRRNVVL